MIVHLYTFTKAKTVHLRLAHFMVGEFYITKAIKITINF